MWPTGWTASPAVPASSPPPSATCSKAWSTTAYWAGADFSPNVREERSQLRVTVLTTLHCNFACDYCIQGDHGDYNKHAAKMSLETAARTAEWAEQRLDAVAPSSFALTFFGGEPLLNLPVLF